MFVLRDKLLAVAAALTLGALLAPRPADASIPSAISHPQVAQAAASVPVSVPSYVLLYVAPDGSCRVEFCRNDPVNVTDPMGLANDVSGGGALIYRDMGGRFVQLNSSGFAVSATVMGSLGSEAVDVSRPHPIADSQLTGQLLERATTSEPIGAKERAIAVSLALATGVGVVLDGFDVVSPGPDPIDALQKAAREAGEAVVEKAERKVVSEFERKAAENTGRLLTGPVYRTAKEARTVAQTRGWKNAKGLESMGEEVYTDGRRFFTRDRTGHKGGAWKELDRKGRRIGTVGEDLQRVGD